MQFRLVARPCKLATKSNSTACSGRHCRQLGRHCRKRVIFVARMSNVLSTFGRLCRIRQNRPCRIRFVASVYRALSSDISESFRGANLRFFYIDEWRHFTLFNFSIIRTLPPQQHVCNGVGEHDYWSFRRNISERVEDRFTINGQITVNHW